MKRLSLTILCCVLLSGCLFDPTFDTSSLDAFQRSSAAIRAKLSNSDLRRLEIALRYLMLESMPRIEIEGQLLTNAVARNNFANPIVILGRLGPRINGKSATSIIQNLSIRLDSEISQAETMLKNAENVMAPVEVTSARYYWRSSGYLARPTIEFTVRNNGKVPISRIYLSGTLTTPGRAIPWVRQQLVQTFKGGLEPHEKQQLTLQPQFGDWNDPQLKDVYDAELKLTVTNFEDANGERVIAVDSDGLEMKRKVRDELR